MKLESLRGGEIWFHPRLRGDGLGSLDLAVS
jgi:hypothetical protein